MGAALSVELACSAANSRVNRSILSLVQRFLISTPINTTPMSLLSLSSPKSRGRFRLRSENFACELENFACEMKSFRQDPRKLLKSLASEINDFAVSRDFKGLRQVLFRALLDLRFFCPCAGRGTSLSYRNLLVARILFIGNANRPGRMSARKAKFAAYVRVHGIDRLVSFPRQRESRAAAAAAKSLCPRTRA
jgi:hypothetical protein